MKILKGNLVSAPALGKLEIIEHGCLVLHDDGSSSCRLLSTCTCMRRSTPCSAWAWTCR